MPFRRYPCEFCRGVGSPGEVARRFIIRHKSGVLRGQVARTIPVCATCQKLLEDGKSYEDVMQMRGRSIVRPPK